MRFGSTGSNRHVDALTAVHLRAMSEPGDIERLASITPAFAPTEGVHR